MSQTYLTIDELSARIKYDVRTIRERLKDSVLLEGTHYLRPFGGRKILFVWEAIERDMRVASVSDPIGLPMANGRCSMAKVNVRKETGKLVLDFTYRGVRCREQTALSDNAANRKRAEAVLKKLREAISTGTFVYSDFFPGSPLASRFMSTVQPAVGAPPANAAAAPTPTLRTFADQWLTNHAVEWRRSHIRVLRSTIDGHLVKHFGDRPVGQISKADILAFRNILAETPGRSVWAPA